jgi:aryl-alcohol dehydrogenase-like predicted oxidoreductase
LARGFLSGKYQRGQEIPGDSRVARDMQGGMAERTKKHFSELAFQVLDQIQEIAEAKRCSPSQLALAWCMRQPGVTSPIIGPRTLEHLTDNLGAIAVEITAEDRSRLDAVSEPEQAIVPYYTGKLIDFRPTLHRW